MIPEGHTIEDIEKREQIIRDFYREWKKKSISRQCEMLNFCPLCVVEVYALRCDAMRAGTSRYPLHRPTTTYCFRARNRIAIRVVIPSTNSPMIPQRSCNSSLFAKTYTYQHPKGVSKWAYKIILLHNGLKFQFHYCCNESARRDLFS